jgi:hypothetical protein
VKSLPTALADKFRLCPTPLDALPGASVLVVATAWPDYRNIEAEMLVSVIKQATVIDPGYFLSDTLGTNPKIQYIAIGKGNI